MSRKMARTGCLVCALAIGLIILSIFKILVWWEDQHRARIDQYYYNNPARGGMVDHDGK